MPVFLWGQRMSDPARQCLIVGNRGTVFTVQRLDDDGVSWAVAYQGQLIPGADYADRHDDAASRRDAMTMAERLWTHSQDHRKCLVCDVDLSAVMLCMVFVAGQEVPEQIAVLCTAHGSDGANDMSAAKFRQLLDARCVRRERGVAATAPQVIRRRRSPGPTLPCGCPLGSCCDGTH